VNTAKQLAAGQVSGRIHSWDLSTGVDGPGARFVLFVSGCPLCCLYCADPDIWHMRDGRQVTVDEVMAELDKFCGSPRSPAPDR
jgi:pyruvate formate lyase activating enzyme